MLNLPVAGFERVSFVNFPHKMACTVWTSGCNLRCRYCYNRRIALGTKANIEIENLLKGIKESQIKYIAVTGGEPFIHKDLSKFLQLLREMKLTIKLDTNGTLPERLLNILNNNLIDYIAVDLKGFDNDDIKYITRQDVKIENVIKCLKVIEESGIDFELRYTIWHSDTKKITKFFEKVLFKKKPKLYLQKFIKTENNLDKRFAVFIEDSDLETLKNCLDIYTDLSIR